MRTPRRTLTAVALALAAAGSTAAAAPGRPEPYRAPTALPTLTGTSSLNARYAAVERNMRTAWKKRSSSGNWGL